MTGLPVASDSSGFSNFLPIKDSGKICLVI